jgi:hypothetical protein
MSDDMYESFSDLDDLRDRSSSLSGAETGAPPPSSVAHEQVIENHYPSVNEFVTYFLSAVYARPVSAQHTSFRWCSQWWDHPEAVARLEALWAAWEGARLQPPPAMAGWWLSYCDPMMRALCNSEGPFQQCSDTQHHKAADLPVISPHPAQFSATPHPTT